MELSFDAVFAEAASDGGAGAAGGGGQATSNTSDNNDESDSRVPQPLLPIRRRVIIICWIAPVIVLPLCV